MATDAFTQWFQARLRENRLSASAFAREKGFARSTVGTWVRGDRVPDPASCDLIADAFGEDRDVVLALAGHRPEADPIPEGDPRRHLHALIDKIQWRNEDNVTRIVIGILEDIRADQLKRPRTTSAQRKP